MKGKASALIEQIKQNTEDIKTLDSSLLPSTLQSCNGSDEVLRFSEGKGWLCEKLDITPLECSGHGTIPEGSDTCQCNEGFDGKQCELLAVFPAGSVVQQIPDGTCESDIGWCPDGNLNIFTLDTIPGTKSDSALITTVEGSVMGTCNVEFRTATQMFRVDCLSAPADGSAFKYVVIIP